MFAPLCRLDRLQEGQLFYGEANLNYKKKGKSHNGGRHIISCSKGMEVPDLASHRGQLPNSPGNHVNVSGAVETRGQESNVFPESKQLCRRLQGATGARRKKQRGPAVDKRRTV